MNNLRSLCHKAKLILESSDEGTSFFRCSQCQKACDPQLINLKVKKSPIHLAGSHLYANEEEKQEWICCKVDCENTAKHCIHHKKQEQTDLEKRFQDEVWKTGIVLSRDKMLQFIRKELSTQRKEIAESVIKDALLSIDATIGKVLKSKEKSQYKAGVIWGLKTALERLYELEEKKYELNK